ncbi:MAG: hypothetical protein Q9166_004912 [cf. Caloplaca sp. 2 TL-2023]
METFATPLYGQRLVPTLIDDLARERSNDLYALIPKTRDFGDGFHEVTFSILARSIDNVAFWLERKVGSSTTFETIAYIGAKEIQVEQLLKGTGARQLVIESLTNVLYKESAGPYAYNRSFGDAKNDPFIVIHTSGSTGLPKPIIIYHGGLATVDGQHNLQSHDGQRPQVQDLVSDTPSLLALPPFHYTRIRNIMGSSESSLMPTHTSNPEDWQSFHYSPDLEGIRFEHVGDNLYEQVIVRSPSTDAYHSTWYTFPDQDRYSTHDLYSKHPSKENMWLYAGRSDDIIVLSNGEKLNPNAMQSALLSHPDVEGALVFGQARFEPAALIELWHGYPQSEEERETFNKSLQPYMDRANESAPAYGKLGYDHVMFAQPDKPMLRADKGTIKRSATLKLYAGEIDDFYDHMKISDASTAVALDVKDRSSLVASLTPLVEKICKLTDMKFDDDFFSLGIDSLQVMTMTRQLKSSIGLQSDTAAQGITPKLIYSNPSLKKLASAIFSLVHPEMDGGEDDKEEARLESMKQMVQDFSNSLPTFSVPKLPSRLEDLTVVLTGSTGSLGSYILDNALSRPGINKVICLNRSADGQSRQLSSHASKGLTKDFGKKVQFLQADLSKAQLGLNDDTYKAIVNEANLIILSPSDNQWQVDFNLSLSSFTPQIAGVHNLITLSATSPVRPPITFTSSISTLGYWPTTHTHNEKVPEAPLHDYSIPTASGYGESKFVAERVLENAAQISGVPSATVRVGQLAGPVEKVGGMWNRKEWLPSLITSSCYLGVLPSTIPGFDDVAWIPVDLAAKAILDLSLSDFSDLSPNGTALYTHNLTNPHPSSWSSLLPTIRSHLSTTTPQHPINIVDYETWLKTLRISSQKMREEDVAEKNPAIKLLDFFEDLVGGEEGAHTVLETKETVRKSETMRCLKGVDGGWMGMWLRQWGW